MRLLFVAPDFNYRVVLILPLLCYYWVFERFLRLPALGDICRDAVPVFGRTFRVAVLLWLGTGLTNLRLGIGLPYRTTFGEFILLGDTFGYGGELILLGDSFGYGSILLALGLLLLLTDVGLLFTAFAEVSLLADRVRD